MKCQTPFPLELAGRREGERARGEATPERNFQGSRQPSQGKAKPLFMVAVAWLAVVSAPTQSSNGSRIIQELRHRSTTEASAGSEAAKRILFCTSVVAEAPGIALASVFTGAPFITGAPVAAYVF